jgi:hypothetical protein
MKEGKRRKSQKENEYSKQQIKNSRLYCWITDSERIEYYEAHGRLLFDHHETSSIIWLGKPAPAIQSF